ncbi:ATP-binding protein [Aliiglaciecola litoralis]|uniref:histidine kinase n=1 Tax=Aliiglaciecola litoralis TaxID=582857 RepID=A0ABP3X3E4_9ALTE
MRWLTKLNPINSLFGKIFLWFWGAAILLVFAGAWIAKLTNDSYSVRPLEAKAEQRLDSIAKRIELVAQRRPDADLSLLLGRAGQRNKQALMLINPRTQEFIYGFPRGLGPLKDPFIELIAQQQAFRIRTAGGMFDGPKALEIDGQLFYLFAGKPFSQGALKRFLRTNPMLLASSVLVISGMLCALLTWSLVKPIRALQKSTRQVSTGNLSQRVEFADTRGDELGALGRDFNAMTQQLEVLLSSQKRLVADISHELRSPLARLQLAIGIAQSHPQPLPESIQKQLARIEKEAQQIDFMIEQVLKLSRLEANASIEAKQRVALSELLSETIDDALFEAQNLGVEMEVATIPDINVDCFPNVLVSAVHNVLSNAIKYCETKVEVSFTLDADTLTLLVCDDGQGVPEQDLHSMFAPFYRLSVSRSRDSGGVGLGLAIVKQAMKLHRGKVFATNRKTSGLAVSLVIPMRE